MDGVDLVILLLHPIAAIAVIIWALNKRARKRFMGSQPLIRKDNQIKSDVRSRILIISWALVLSGFIANFIYNYRINNTDIIEILLPGGVGGLHSIGGILGIFFLTLVSIRKKRASNHVHDVDEGKRKKKPGMLSQNLVTIVIIAHAFLGFLWLIELVSA